MALPFGHFRRRGYGGVFGAGCPSGGDPGGVRGKNASGGVLGSILRNNSGGVIGTEAKNPCGSEALAWLIGDLGWQV